MREPIENGLILSILCCIGLAGCSNEPDKHDENISELERTEEYKKGYSAGHSRGYSTGYSTGYSMGRIRYR